MKEGFSEYIHPIRFTSDQELIEASNSLHKQMEGRRSIRRFSDKPIPPEVVNNIVRIAASAPSGAHKQPWHFAVVSKAEVKQKIREAAEREEYTNYHGRMSEEWLNDLKKFGTDWHKEFLTTAPYLIIAFKKSYDIGHEGDKHKNYYVNESVGIACGFLLAAIHQLGLVSLTHTPSPMNFLAELLGRPTNEKAFLLIPLGYANQDATFPNISRKSLDEVMTKY